MAILPLHRGGQPGHGVRAAAGQGAAAQGGAAGGARRVRRVEERIVQGEGGVLLAVGGQRVGAAEEPVAEDGAGDGGKVRPREGLLQGVGGLGRGQAREGGGGGLGHHGIGVAEQRGQRGHGLQVAAHGDGPDDAGLERAGGGGEGVAQGLGRLRPRDGLQGEAREVGLHGVAEERRGRGHVGGAAGEREQAEGLGLLPGDLRRFGLLPAGRQGDSTQGKQHRHQNRGAQAHGNILRVECWG